MMLKSVKNFISNLGDLIVESTEVNTSGFVDESLGKMKQQDVLAIVLPIAEKAKYVSENSGTVFGQKEIGLFHYAKTNRLVWIVNFCWLESNGEKVGNHSDNVIASIKVDDETKEILSVWQRGMSFEMNYSEFLKLPEANKDEE